MQGRKWSEVKVGLLVAIGLTLIAALILNSANWRRGIGGKILKARFNFVANLQLGAPVHMSGVQIGKVIGMKLLEEGVEVEMRIKSPIPLRKGCVASIGFLGVVGETYVEIKNGPVGNPPVENNGLIEGRDPSSTAEVLKKAEEAAKTAVEVVRSTLELVNHLRPQLDQTIAKLSKTIDKVSTGFDRFNRTLNSLQSLSNELQSLIAENRRELNRIVAKVDELTDKVARDYDVLKSQTSSLLDRAGEEISSTNQEVKQVINAANRTFKKVDELSTKVEKAVDRMQAELLTSAYELKDEAVSDLKEARELLKELSLTSSTIRGTAAKLDGMLKRLERGEGTAGKLISSDETLRKIHTALESLNGAARSVSKAVESFKSDYNLGGRSLGWDASFRYVNLPGSFRSSISLRVGSLMGGVRMEGSKPLFDLQYIKPFNLKEMLFRLRIGTLRSRAGLGLDLHPIRWLGISTELIDTGEDKPRVDSFFSLRLYKNLRLIFGGEDLLDRKGITFGVMRCEEVR